MRDPDPTSVARAQQYRHAVGHEYRADDAGSVGPRGIGLRFLAGTQASGIDHRGAVHLVQPGGLAGQSRAHSLTVGGHDRRVVPRAQAEVEARVRAVAEASFAGGDQAAYRGGRWPLRDDPPRATGLERPGGGEIVARAAVRGEGGGGLRGGREACGARSGHGVA